MNKHQTFQCTPILSVFLDSSTEQCQFFLFYVFLIQILSLRDQNRIILHYNYYLLIHLNFSSHNVTLFDHGGRPYLKLYPQLSETSSHHQLVQVGFSYVSGQIRNPLQGIHLSSNIAVWKNTPPYKGRYSDVSNYLSLLLL